MLRRLARARAIQIRDFVRTFVRKNRAFKWLALLLVLGLSVTTIYTLKNMHRFFTVEKQILIDPQFRDGDRFWGHFGASGLTNLQGRLRLYSDATTNSKVVQNVPIRSVGKPVFVYLSLNASSNKIVAKDSSGAGGGVLLVYRNEQGAVISGDRVLLLEGSSQTANYSHIESLKETVSSVDVVFRLSHARGSMTISNPFLSTLIERPFYKAIEALLLFFWVVVVVAVFVIALPLLKVMHLGMFLFLAGLALVGVLLPEQLMGVVTQKLVSLVPNGVADAFHDQLARIYTTSKLSNPNASLSKVGHFFVFAGIGLFAGISYRTFGLVYVSACVGVFALMTEALQMFVIGRTTSIDDLYLDCFAGILGVLVGAFFVALSSRIRGRLF